MKIVVIGGTGLIGSKAVAILRRVVTMFWQNLPRSCREKQMFSDTPWKKPDAAVAQESRLDVTKSRRIAAASGFVCNDGRSGKALKSPASFS
jgi:hypothetical protein